MKNNEELTRSVLSRSREIVDRQRKREKLLCRVGSSAACLCLCGLIGFSLWQGKLSLPSVTEPAIQPTEQGEADRQPTSQNNSVFSPQQGESARQEGTVIRLISGWKSDAPAVPLIPDNGSVLLSSALTQALQATGDEENVRYRVAVQMFRNGSPLDLQAAQSEWNRLIGEHDLRSGEMVTETFTDASGVSTTWFILHVAAEGLDPARFPASPDCGYAMVLYDELAGTGSTAPETRNSASVIF